MLDYKSGDAKRPQLEINRDTCTCSNECVEYTVHNLSPNTKYQFQVAMVNELGMKGDFTDICETRTGKQNVLSLSTIVLYSRE